MEILRQLLSDPDFYEQILNEVKPQQIGPNYEVNSNNTYGGRCVSLFHEDYPEELYGKFVDLGKL